MIKPLHDNVILKKDEVENKTSSGIILTTETKKIPSVATVVALGPDCKSEIKENSKVVYKEYSGTNIKIDEVDYIVIEVPFSQLRKFRPACTSAGLCAL